MGIDFLPPPPPFFFLYRGSDIIVMHKGSKRVLLELALSFFKQDQDISVPKA